MGILLLVIGCPGSISGLAQGMVLLLGMDADESSRLLCLASGTILSTGTRLAIFCRKSHFDCLGAMPIAMGSPTHARLADVGQVTRCCSQSTTKCLAANPFPSRARPLRVISCGSQQIDPIVLLALYQQLRIQVASIDDMLVGQEMLLFERFMDALSYRIISH